MSQYDKLKTLKIRRSSIKVQLTKFKKYLEELNKCDLEPVLCEEFLQLSLKFEKMQSEIEILNHGQLDERDLESDIED